MRATVGAPAVSRFARMLPDRPAAATQRELGALALAALLVLGALAWLHPELRFVDFIGFSGRAQRLAVGGQPGVPALNGGDVVNGLYPIGYPLLLVLGHALTGSVLPLAKAVSVVAGALAVGAAGRLAGIWAGALTLTLLNVLTLGATEGTDMPAAALLLAALAVAFEPGPRAALTAGILGGLACDVRYTAIAGLPVLLLVSPARARVALGLLVATAPHWATALATHAPLLPDQSENLALAAGHPTHLLSWETLARWPGGVVRALGDALDGPGAKLGAVGLLVGAARRDPRAWALAGLAGAHVALLGVAFSNPRLALPATLALAAGAGWLLRPALLTAVAAVSLALSARPALQSDASAVAAQSASDAASETLADCFATSPWLHQRQDGWLRPSIQLSGLRTDPRTLTPDALVELAAQHNVGCVGLDLSRTRGAFPRLGPLLSGDRVDGFELLGHPQGWRVWRIGPAGSPAQATAAPAFTPSPWTALAPGVEFATFAIPAPTVSGPPRLDVVRVDPALADLRLAMASTVDGRPRTPRRWADELGGVAAINAAMFAADGVSNVGFARDGAHMNHAARKSDYNSLLVTGPSRAGLPAFHVANLECATWDALLGDYRAAIQSIRMLDCAGKNVWSDQPKEWSAALIGEDRQGRGLLLFSRAPYRMHALVDALLALPLDLVALHYGDGGPPASLYVKLPTGPLERVGSWETAVFESEANETAQAIPNAVVVVPRTPTP